MAIAPAATPETTGASAPRNPEFGSDLIVDLLLDLGIEYAAFNPGATFRGIHDSIVNYADNRPHIVECTHEEISVAIAHGYAKAAGKPMAAIVHDIVGLQHATMAIFNAWCDRVPVLVLGATGPMDITRRRPWIDWLHTANVQGSQVRDYTKWDDQPYSVQAVPESLIRAVHIASAAPQGPVYVAFDADIQEQPMPAQFETVDVRSFAQPSPVAPDPAAVREIASWLLSAKRPAIVADRAGRSQRIFELLVQLAELLAIPVIDDQRSSLNFPTAHPLYLAGASKEILDEADVVLGLDSRDLFGALHRTDYATRQVVPSIRPGTKVAHVTLDMFITRSWANDFQRLQPGQLIVPADMAMFLEALLPECRKGLESQPGASGDIEHRRQRLSSTSADLRRKWSETAKSKRAESPISLASAAQVLWDAIKRHDYVLSSGTLSGWTHRIWEMERADRFMGSSGGAGLGYGLGGSIGVALAHHGTDRVIVNIQSDGDGLMTPGALWTMAQQNLPILVVMDNNRSYQNSTEHAERVARVRKRPAENKGVGTEITGPNVDFAMMARSYGMHGEGPVETMDGLSAAVKRALKVVAEDRKPALVDVITQPR